MVTETHPPVVDDGVDAAREAYEDARLHAETLTVEPVERDDLANDDLGADDRAHMLLADITSAGIALDDTVREWTHRDFVDRIELCEFAVALTETVDILTTVLRHVRAHANGLLADGEELRLPGGWTAKPGRPSATWKWDAEQLRDVVHRAVRARAAEYHAACRDAGLDPDVEAVELATEIATAMFDVLSNSKSGGWKTGGLKTLGISPDRYREKTDVSPAMVTLKAASLAERFREGETVGEVAVSPDRAHGEGF